MQIGHRDAQRAHDRAARREAKAARRQSFFPQFQHANQDRRKIVAPLVTLARSAPVTGRRTISMTPNRNVVPVRFVRTLPGPPEFTEMHRSAGIVSTTRAIETDTAKIPERTQNPPQLPAAP